VSRRFTRAEAKWRAAVGAIWLGAVALATVLALTTRSDDAGVASNGAFYLVFLSIPGVLLGVVMIRQRAILFTTAAFAALWSVWNSWNVLRSPNSTAALGILVTPMVAFVIVAFGCGTDLVFRERESPR
jgi:hypothetical protein